MSLEKQHLYEFGEFTLDTSERQLWRGRESVSIPPKAFETLCLMVENHGKLMSKDVLMNELWADTFVEERNLAQNIFLIRKVLGEDKNGNKFIETVPKRGYRFVAEVRPIETIEEELIEISLADKTTITAEGNLSSKDLAETAQKTAEKLVGEQTQAEAEIKQIEKPKSVRVFRRFSPMAVSAVAVVAALTIGAAYWIKSSSENAAKNQNSFEVAPVNLEQITDNGKAWHPTISPDNKYVAFVYRDKSRDSVHLQNLETGSVTEVVPPTDAEFYAAVFSKDGNYIFYPARDGGKEATVYKVPILGGSKQVVLTNVQSYIDLSPDGEWLTFIRPDDKEPINVEHLMIARIDGSGEERVVASRRLKDTFLVWGVSPVWSPDGKKIISGAFTVSESENEELDYYLIEIDVETGAEKRINVPELSFFSQPRWMPDGKSLMVLAKEKMSSPTQIWQISYPDGKARRITNDLVNYERLAISSDGKFLITNEWITTYNLSLVDIESGKITERLTNTTALMNGVRGIDWSPDGKKIVYAQSDGSIENIWLYDFDSKQSRQITFDETYKNRYPHFTPDGNSIYFLTNCSGNGQIWKIDLDGSNLEQITRGLQKETLTVSPDGKWMFYRTPGVMWRRSMSEGKDVKLVENGGYVVVSQDSKQILLTYYDTTEKDKVPWKKGFIPIESTEKPEPANFLSHSPPTWHPDGTGVYYPNHEKSLNNIWFYSIADRTSRQITNFEKEHIIYLKISPDGKQIVVSRGSRNGDVIKISGF